jgi:hypothetical protein
MMIPVPVYALLLATLFQVSPAPPGVEQLAWMAGSWKGDSGGAAVEEHWTAPSAGSMIGMNRTVFGGRKVSFEFLRIEARPDGVFYIASPGGRPPTPFKLKETSKEKVVFENPEHDFPQRVLYWRNGAELCARVEGKQKEKPAAEEWCWKPMR